jgi:hypothetical protein
MEEAVGNLCLASKQSNLGVGKQSLKICGTRQQGMRSQRVGQLCQV